MDETARTGRTELDAQLRSEVEGLLGDGCGIEDIGQNSEKLNALLDRLIQAWSSRLQQLRSELNAETELRREMERKLRIYSEALRCTHEAVVIADLDGTIIDVNPAYEHALGQVREQAIGASLHHGLLGDDTGQQHGDVWPTLRKQGAWAGEVTNRNPDGKTLSSWVNINAISDDQGYPTCYVGVSRDVDSASRGYAGSERVGFYDPLTRLPNRALFNDRLEMALADASRRHSLMAVIHLEIDQFKYVNDTLGCAVGDQLILEISRRITSSIRGADTIARCAGDEFTVLLTHLEASFEAVYIVERLIESIGLPVELDETTVRVGANAGISYFPNDGQDGESLQKYAALALHEAKARGPRQHCLFNSEMLARSNERLSLGVQLENALHQDGFTLNYQPIINVKTGIADSMEALIRWQKPDGRWIPPGTFIPYAEAVGLIYRIDCWVLERACGDAASWARNGENNLGVAVNLSAVSVQQPNMARVVEDILLRTHLPAAMLTLEITETAVISDPHVARRVLDEIVALGVSLSVDDFGTGHSSLSYLTQFPIDYIKLDRLFVSRIGKDIISEKVIQSVLELAQKLGLRVIAEGIEEPEQQSFLTVAGCELMQGFYLMKPLYAHQLGDWLKAHRMASSGGMIDSRSCLRPV